MSSNTNNNDVVERDICVHIFSVSSGLLGVCLTVLGLFRALAELRSLDTIGDDLLVLAAATFLAACFFSYFAMRSKVKGRIYKLERLADILFLIGLSLIGSVCVLITYAIY